MLVGHARFRDATGWATLDYVVRCDLAWVTQSCDVTGTQGGGGVSLRLQRKDADWCLNDVWQPALAGCDAVALGFTPATTLMPVRRLPDVGVLRTRAAWLRLPGPLLDPLEQSYTRERGGFVRCETCGAEARHLEVDSAGFVMRYPGAWARAD